MENTITVKENLELTEYVSLVENIAEGFFDEEGNYQPHIGKLNTMRLFYNEYVIESNFDIPHGFSGALQLRPLINDNEFIYKYNQSLNGDGYIRLDFANAYRDAMKIVKTKKDSLNGLILTVKNVIKKAVNSFSESLSAENIEKLSKIAESIGEENFDLDSFKKLYTDYLKKDET